MTYARMRRALCRWFSLHGFELIEQNYKHEHGKCPWCDLESWTDNETRTVRFTREAGA